MVDMGWLAVLLILVAPASVGANTTAVASVPSSSPPSPPPLVSTLSNPDHTATLVFAVIAAVCALCACIGVWWKPQLLAKMIAAPRTLKAPAFAAQEHSRPLV